jgi:tripartite-type tricarboxylate transporter receptor subunit TctC
LIENKAGASGSIGAGEVARAAPDGHTILCSISTTYVMNRIDDEKSRLRHGQGSDAGQHYSGCRIAAGRKPEIRGDNLDEFVAFARKNGKVNFGTYSAGSAPHMTINELNKQYGLNIEPVHYRGEAPMWTGLMEGTLDVAMGSYTAAQAVLQSNRGVAFAVHSKKVDAILRTSRPCPSKARHRSSSPISGFTGWALPKATPQPIVDRLAELCVAANNDPRVKEVLATFRPGAAVGFQGDQCVVSARIAGLDGQREIAGTGAGLKGGRHYECLL